MNTKQIKTAATQFAKSLVVGVQYANKVLADELEAILVAADRDMVAAGKAIGVAWGLHGVDHAQGEAQPARLIVEACWENSFDKSEAREILKATELVSKQRISQLLAIVYDGGTNGSVNPKSGKGGKGNGDPVSAILAILSKGNGDPVSAILAILSKKGLTLTRSDAARITKAALALVKAV